MCKKICVFLLLHHPGFPVKLTTSMFVKWHPSATSGEEERRRRRRAAKAAEAKAKERARRSAAETEKRIFRSRERDCFKNINIITARGP